MAASTPPCVDMAFRPLAISRCSEFAVALIEPDRFCRPPSCRPPISDLRLQFRLQSFETVRDSVALRLQTAWARLRRSNLLADDAGLHCHGPRTQSLAQLLPSLKKRLIELAQRHSACFQRLHRATRPAQPFAP